jgi:XTP/dITP diphosphohydrolase
MEKILVFATNNPHKAREVEQVLGSGFVIKTLRDIGCLEDIPETGDTLEENALIKAKHVKVHFGYDCFSEDTGLEVVALGGKPGVHTAHYAGPERCADANMALLLQQMMGQPDRTAQFRTVIALVRGTETLLLEGVCPGSLATTPIGNKGFGYDPIFIPQGYRQTFGEMEDALKNDISHRAKAVKKLLTCLR